MPAEARYIVFSLEEVEALLRRFAHARKLPLPDGRLRRVEAADDGLRFTFENDFSRKQAFVVDQTLVLAAVLLDCRHQGVPIPRRFDRRLEPLADAMALVSAMACVARPAEAALQRAG